MQESKEGAVRAPRPGTSAVSRAKLMERIRALHAEWMPILGLGDWTDQSYVCEEPDGKTYAEVEKMQWEYKRFAIRYFPDLALHDDDFLEAIVLHELIHVLRDPERRLLFDLIDQVDTEEDDLGDTLREFYRMHDERLTTELAHALIRARRAGRGCDKT